jgi:hypothetical protein
MEPGITMLDLSVPQWLAFIGFGIATIAFAIWVLALHFKK